MDTFSPNKGEIRTLSLRLLCQLAVLGILALPEDPRTRRNPTLTHQGADLNTSFSMWMLDFLRFYSEVFRIIPFLSQSPPISNTSPLLSSFATYPSHHPLAKRCQETVLLARTPCSYHSLHALDPSPRLDAALTPHPSL
jgi:hypothetical protein